MIIVTNWPNPAFTGASRRTQREVLASRGIGACDRNPNLTIEVMDYRVFFSCSIAARRIALIRVWYRGYRRKCSSTSRSSRMLISSFDFGITSVAEANQSASRIGAASGSFRTASSICASVSALTRAQSVRRRSASALDLFFEETLLTGVSLLAEMTRRSAPRHV